jgi:hypothetical protein
MTIKRQIVTKHRIYELAPDAEGVPIGDYFPRVTTWPEGFAGAKVYETSDGPVIAVRRDFHRRALRKPTP